jgi:hypothetical protein
MKIKKAVRRLEEVEARLARVVEKCEPAASPLRVLLDEARAAVTKAKVAFQDVADRDVPEPPSQPKRKKAKPSAATRVAKPSDSPKKR